MTAGHYIDIYNQIYIHGTYIITFLFYEAHAHPNTPHGGGMSLLHSHFAREKDVIKILSVVSSLIALQGLMWAIFGEK